MSSERVEYSHALKLSRVGVGGYHFQEWLLLLLHVGKVPVRKDMFRKINRITYDTKRDGEHAPSF